jgi:hypothetical protein
MKAPLQRLIARESLPRRIVSWPSTGIGWALFSVGWVFLGAASVFFQLGGDIAGESDEL